MRRKILVLEIMDKGLRRVAQAIFTPPVKGGIILQYDYKGKDEEPLEDAKKILEKWYATAGLDMERLVIIELARALGDGEATVKVIDYD